MKETIEEFFLTENGWTTESGAQGMVEKWKVRQTQITPFMPVLREWINDWVAAGATEADRNALRERYPFPDTLRPHPMIRVEIGQPLRAG